MSTATMQVSNKPSTARRRFTVRERVLLWLITWAGFLAIRLIGPTLRVTVSCEEGAPDPLLKPPLIYAFWHRCVMPAAWQWRDADIRVMTSSSFDGEYIARIISKLGFVPVRGSSSRGGMEALRNMAQESEHAVAAFTVDGPRGPKYVAKRGPVLLARSSGAPMAAFHMAVEKAWVLNTWDDFMVPKPFSRVLTRVSKQMFVPAAADGAGIESSQRELQASLDRVRMFAEANVGKEEKGTLTDGVYHNPLFGFSYKPPFGWVDRTDNMQDGSEPGKSMVLLSMFERPPEVTGEGLNPAVVIAAESVSSYPGLKSAADYLGPMSEVAKSKGFKVENETYEDTVGGKKVAREDFSKKNGYQSSVAWIDKRYVVSATFIAANADDVQELVEGLKFTTARRK